MDSQTLKCRVDLEIKEAIKLVFILMRLVIIKKILYVYYFLPSVSFPNTLLPGE